jgi:hypothetical protein
MGRDKRDSDNREKDDGASDNRGRNNKHRKYLGPGDGGCIVNGGILSGITMAEVLKEVVVIIGKG